MTVVSGIDSTPVRGEGIKTTKGKRWKGTKGMLFDRVRDVCLRVASSVTYLLSLQTHYPAGDQV